MHKPSYYRNQAKRARRLAGSATNGEIAALLSRMGQDYDDLAEDLETGAKIRHPELMPQNPSIAATVGCRSTSSA